MIEPEISLVLKSESTTIPTKSLDWSEDVIQVVRTFVLPETLTSIFGTKYPLITVDHVSQSISTIT